MEALTWTALPVAAVVVALPMPAAAADPSSVQPSGSITGVVTDAATGTPLANDCDLTISAHYADGFTYAVKRFTGCLDADGRYTIAGLPPDRYRVEVTDASGSYFDQYPTDPNSYLTGASTEFRSQVVTVTNGSATSVDVPLTRAGSLAGLITDAATGQPLANDCDVKVELQWEHGSALGPAYTSGCTDANGQFTIPDMEPGDYDYAVIQPGYVHQTGEVSVAAAQQSRVDAALVVSADLNVVYRSSTDDQPLRFAPYAVLGVIDPTNPSRWVAGTVGTTSYYGVLGVRDVAPGTYQLDVGLEGGVTYRNRTWRFSGPKPTVTLTSGETSAVFVHLQPGRYRRPAPPPAPPKPPSSPRSTRPTGSITGVIRDAQTGQPLTGDCHLTITVGTRFAHPSNSAEMGEVVPTRTWTGCLDANGGFRVRGLPATTGRYSEYTVYVVDNADRYGARYLGDTPSSYRAKYVSVHAHRTTSGADVTIPELATISGTLYDADTGAPLSNVCGITVSGYRFETVTLCTDASGGYTVTGVKTGPYQSVQFTPASTYEPHAWMSRTVPLTLAAGEHRTDIDAYLVPIPGA